MYRRALVTGASCGIGLAFAERLAADGCDLVLVARSQERLEAIARRLEEAHHITAKVLVADLTADADVARVEEHIRSLDDLDLLVNNAGFGTYGRFAELPIGGEVAEIRLNVLALSCLTHAALPGMIARKRGAVLNVSSLASFQAAPYNATYAATKAFVTSFTEAISEELRDTGVRVQALCPGITRTEFQERAGIDASATPELVMMTAEEVVESSMAALERNEVVHISGLANRVVAGASAIFPRAIVRYITGRAMARLGGLDARESH